MDSEKPHSLGSLATRMACTLVGLLLLYVASFGPYNYVCIRFNIKDTRVVMIYAPLMWLVHRSETVAVLLDPYVTWFGDLAEQQRDKTGDDLLLPP